MGSFTITRLTDHTGAEIVGLDFKQPIDTQSRTALSRAFAEHHVLVMRDQHFSAEQYKAAAQVFEIAAQSRARGKGVGGHLAHRIGACLFAGRGLFPARHRERQIPRSRRARSAIQIASAAAATATTQRDAPAAATAMSANPAVRTTKRIPRARMH